MTAPASQVPIQVSDVKEEYAWLKAHPCECGGSWSLVMQSVGKLPGAPKHVRLDQLEVSCSGCSRQASFLFLVDKQSPRAPEGQKGPSLKN
jgi:hypothetical protein